MNGKFYVRKTDAEDRDLIGKYAVIDDNGKFYVHKTDTDKFFATREEAELALIVAKIKGVAT